MLDFLLAQTTIRVQESNAHNFISLLNEIERIHSSRLIVTWRDRTRFTIFHKFTSLSKSITLRVCLARSLGLKNSTLFTLYITLILRAKINSVSRKMYHSVIYTLWPIQSANFHSLGNGSGRVGESAVGRPH